MLKWLIGTKTYPLYLTSIQKILFLLTNSLYILPNIGHYDLNSCIIFSIGILSSTYHMTQCYNCSCIVGYCYLIEGFMVTILTIILFLNRKSDPNINWYLLLIPTLLCYIFGNKNRSSELYTVLHGGWHILSSILLLSIK